MATKTITGKVTGADGVGRVLARVGPPLAMPAHYHSMTPERPT